jgi:hypothetical protein
MNSKVLKILLPLIVIAAIATAAYFYSIKADKKKEISSVSTVNYKFGVTNACRSIPSFIRSLKMKAPSLDSRQQDESIGLLIRDNAQKNKTWQHKSWLDSGYIGGFDRDQKGNIYVAPMPYVSLLKNPPEKQNRIYQIDAGTAEMSLFMKLPTQNPPNAKNPFGTMGLYYDCDTHSLYVSSLAGSLPMKERGVIYQIDVRTKKILSKLENTDAIGVGVFNSKKGKRLYFGSARNSHLYSIGLDKKGHFKGDKKYEVSLSQVRGGDTTVIKKVQFRKFKNKMIMTLKEVEFGFRLTAENNPNKKKYAFELDETNNKWLFQGISRD